MSNLNKLNGWTEESEYISRNSAQSYMVSGSVNRTSASCGSSCGSEESDTKPLPSSCGTGDSESLPSSCGAGEIHPKPSACGAGEGDSNPKPSACGSSCGAGEK